jgi:hypothetical protein
LLLLWNGDDDDGGGGGGVLFFADGPVVTIGGAVTIAFLQS